jgi:hypothetical protein
MYPATFQPPPSFATVILSMPDLFANLTSKMFSFVSPFQPINAYENLHTPENVIPLAFDVKKNQGGTVNYSAPPPHRIKRTKKGIQFWIVAGIPRGFEIDLRDLRTCACPMESFHPISSGSKNSILSLFYRHKSIHDRICIFP